MSLELINITVDAIFMIVLAAAVRMHMSRFNSLDNRLAKTLSEDEIKKLIDHKIANHLQLIHYQFRTISETLDKITKVTLKEDSN